MSTRPEVPGPGQESVWDYPRPPRLEATDRHVRIIFNGEVVADTRRAFRVLETSHPPTYYIPAEDVRAEYLEPALGSSFCEWKGRAVYHSVRVRERVAPSVAWSYPSPTAEFAPIAGHLAFYAGPMDEVTVDGMPVEPQPGGFYGGWITPDVVGPFKGVPGSHGW